MVEVACDPGLPVVWADHDRLEQVFVNLLDNALGHNPPGTQVSVSAAVAGEGGIAISVLDDGAGIPSEMASAPFEPTRRRRSPTAGAGLGLSIARGIVEAHGGRIELEQPARGTRFLIHLPVEMPAGPDGRSADPAASPTGLTARDDLTGLTARDDHDAPAASQRAGVRSA
jgi:signal transduction histidine kinase